MNTNKSLQTSANRDFQEVRLSQEILKTAIHFLLPVLSQLIELSFPGLLNGIVLTPEMIAMFLKSISRSAQSQNC